MVNDSQMAKRIMVALDVASLAEARELWDELQGIPCYMKVGMELYYAAGPPVVHELKERGYNVFLDLKLHDIPNQVKGAAKSITALNVDMFNVHAAGGKAMMEAALAGVEEALQEHPSLQHPTVIAVTQLTSTNSDVLKHEIGINMSIEQAVIHYAQLAKQAGLQGVVASPHEVKAIKQTLGTSFQTVTPGIRPVGTDHGDQARVMTPQQALAAGTDFMVIGRPITAAAQPRAALLHMIKELEENGTNAQ